MGMKRIWLHECIGWVQPGELISCALVQGAWMAQVQSPNPKLFIVYGGWEANN